ncbi:phage tail tape measure protein [Paenibacillus contaminans]|nr:phage tail tape measure protein [Paenibacillus contaminans]
MAGRSREYDIAFRLQGLMDSSFRRSMGDAEGQIEELERALRQMNKRGDFEELRKDAGRAGDAINEAEGNVKGFGDTLRRVAEYTGAFAIVQGVAGSFQNIVGTVGEFENSMAQLQASAGLSAQEMREIESSVDSLYRTPIGENFDDLTRAMGTVKQVTKQTGDVLQTTTKDAIVFRDVFGEEVTQSIKAVDTMMRHFGITSNQSYNLLAQGAQNGLNKSDELLDTANEYAPQFAALGFTANQMFDIFATGLEAGAWNLDKVGDAVKEFNIRLKDGSKSTHEAMAQLFAPDKIDEFAVALVKGSSQSAEYLKLLQHVSKDTADQLVAHLKKGGSNGAEAMIALQSILGDSEKIFQGLTDGSMTGAQAMQQVISQLQRIEDPLQRNQLGVALMGTQFEDLEQTVISAMGNSRSQFDMTKETMIEIASVKYDTLGKQFQTIGRTLMTDLVLPISEDVMPALQGMANWATDNPDLIKALALGVPAALIGKNAASLIKGFVGVERSAAGAGAVVSRFGAALPLLTNPIGAAVAGVGVLTLGVMAYRRHQERARQALVHMSNDLIEASSAYEEVTANVSETKKLVDEYEDLSQIVETNTDQSRNLTAEKERLAEITKRLQEIYPETITQYDVENGKIKEKIGLLGQEAAANAELARLRLEKEVAEKSQDLPDLEKEIQRLEKQKSAVDAQKNAYDAAIPAFKQFEAEFLRIMQMDESEERGAKILALRDKVNEFGDSVGYHFNHLGDLLGTADELSKKRIDVIEEQIQATEELGASKISYEELYKAQKSLIELNLGGKLEEQAAKFNAMSTEEKRRFNEALASLTELNKQMDLLPTEKQVRVKMLFDEVNEIKPLWMNPITRFEQFADGGIATKPSIFAEAGPEIAIPLDNRPRSHSLLDLANNLMGHDYGQSEGGDDISVTYAPQIIVQGGGPSDVTAFEQALKRSQDDFERRFKAMLQQQKRVKMA